MSVALTLPSKAGALGVSISSVSAMSAMTTHAPQHAGADMDCSTRLRSPGSDSGMIITPVPCVTAFGKEWRHPYILSNLDFHTQNLWQ